MKPKNKKILIITYYWPPAGGPGVQRWLKFVKYLPSFGFEPHVYVPKNPSYPLVDEKLMQEISNQVIIIKKPIFEPYGLASIFSKKSTKKISSGILPNKKKQSLIEKCLLWIRGNIFIPDARVFWVNPSVNFLKKYCEENDIKTIITSGPPHSLHLIGLRLKNETNVNWIADFRDPWTTIGYHKDLKLSKKAVNKHLELEKRVLQNANQIIVTSESTKLEFQKITNQPIAIITNGYDEENVQKKEMDSTFSMAHIGSLLSERNPKILWKVLAELVNEREDFASIFQLKLIGAVSQDVLKSIQDFGLDFYVNQMGYVAHQEALLEQRCSQVLLLIEIDREETKCIIPGKLFEYMVSERPIIGIGPQNADFKYIIEKTNTGKFFSYDEEVQLKHEIIRLFECYKNQSLKVSPIGLNQYSRKNLTLELSKIINSFYN